MSKEEIKEYLKRVDELELKLTGEDRDTLQWLIFGYNECARLLNETEQENQILKEQLKEIQMNKTNYTEVNILTMLNHKYKSVLDEIREYIKENSFYIKSSYGKQVYEDVCFEILQILDKAGKE